MPIPDIDVSLYPGLRSSANPRVSTRAGLVEGLRNVGDPSLPPLQRPLAPSFAATGFGFKGHFNMPTMPSNVAGTFTEGNRFTISPDGQRLYFRGGRDDNTYTYVNIADVGGNADFPLPEIPTYGRFRSMPEGWGRPLGGAIVGGILYMPYSTIYDTDNGMEGKLFVGYDPDTLEQVTGTARAQYEGSLSAYRSYDDGSSGDVFTTRMINGPLRQFPQDWAEVFGYPCYMTPGVAHSISGNSNNRHGFTLIDPTQLTTENLSGFQDITIKPVLYNGGPQGAGNIAGAGPRDMNKVPPPGFVLPDSTVINSENINGSGFAWGWAGAEGMAGGGFIIPGTRTFVYVHTAAMTGTAGKGWGLRGGNTSYQGDQYECLAFFYDLAEIKEVADGQRLIENCLPYHFEKMPGVQEDISTGMGRWIGINNNWTQGNFVQCPVTGNVYGFVGGGNAGPYYFYNPETGEIDSRSAPYNVASTVDFRDDKRIYIWGPSQ